MGLKLALGALIILAIILVAVFFIVPGSDDLGGVTSAPSDPVETPAGGAND
ncbi:hypothetical protein ABID21_000807 [Pseudorhizobium tarimense]|uniref:Uncharacterized protein n=1 Tax=Pseudorhizobium tarimense TaxID=1079109 RepID=A0ABV2H2D2_9HYPH|nr:hypothetical protein [Pseudorhizobium tarimense]MCJ8517680.1 hypothetical protein [Pseudorhizobium tarimense]